MYRPSHGIALAGVRDHRPLAARLEAQPGRDARLLPFPSADGPFEPISPIRHPCYGSPVGRVIGYIPGNPLAYKGPLTSARPGWKEA